VCLRACYSLRSLHPCGTSAERVCLRAPAEGMYVRALWDSVGLQGAEGMYVCALWDSVGLQGAEAGPRST